MTVEVLLPVGGGRPGPGLVSAAVVVAVVAAVVVVAVVAAVAAVAAAAPGAGPWRDWVWFWFWSGVCGSRV